jgi:hypothetical protein
MKLLASDAAVLKSLGLSQLSQLRFGFALGDVVGTVGCGLSSQLIILRTMKYLT